MATAAVAEEVEFVVADNESGDSYENGRIGGNKIQDITSSVEVNFGRLRQTDILRHQR